MYVLHRGRARQGHRLRSLLASGDSSMYSPFKRCNDAKHRHTEGIMKQTWAGTRPTVFSDHPLATPSIMLRHSVGTPSAKASADAHVRNLATFSSASIRSAGRKKHESAPVRLGMAVCGCAKQEARKGASQQDQHKDAGPMHDGPRACPEQSTT
mmetsp:Transcript_53887/g.125327  ORF Transcript_53887/g.125327 Transcript_53887/m.125327 type:complete len:154 (-) Transcript_53887:19-480(-)